MFVAEAGITLRHFKNVRMPDGVKFVKERHQIAVGNGSLFCRVPSGWNTDARPRTQRIPAGWNKDQLPTAFIFSTANIDSA